MMSATHHATAARLEYCTAHTAGPAKGQAGDGIVEFPDRLGFEGHLSFVGCSSSSSSSRCSRSGDQLEETVGWSWAASRQRARRSGRAGRAAARLTPPAIGRLRLEQVVVPRVDGAQGARQVGVVDPVEALLEVGVGQGQVKGVAHRHGGADGRALRLLACRQQQRQHQRIMAAVTAA